MPKKNENANPNAGQQEKNQNQEYQTVTLLTEREKRSLRRTIDNVLNADEITTDLRDKLNERLDDLYYEMRERPSKRTPEQREALDAIYTLRKAVQAQHEAEYEERRKKEAMEERQRKEREMEEPLNIIHEEIPEPTYVNNEMKALLKKTAKLISDHLDQIVVAQVRVQEEPQMEEPKTQTESDKARELFKAAPKQEAPKQEAPKQPLHDKITYRVTDPMEGEGGFYRMAQYLNDELEKLDEFTPREKLVDTLLTLMAARSAMFDGAGSAELYDEERLKNYRKRHRESGFFDQIVSKMSDNEIISAFSDTMPLNQQIWDLENEKEEAEKAKKAQEEEKTEEKNFLREPDESRTIRAFKYEAAKKRKHTDLNTKMDVIEEVDEAEDEIENAPKQEEPKPKSPAELACDNMALAWQRQYGVERTEDYPRPDSKQLVGEIVRLKKAVKDQTATEEEKNALKYIEYNATAHSRKDSNIFLDRQAEINSACVVPLAEITADAKLLHYRLTQAIPREKMTPAWKQMDDDLKKLADTRTDTPIAKVKEALKIGDSLHSLDYDKSKFKNSVGIHNSIAKLFKKAEKLTVMLDNVSIQKMPIRLDPGKSLLEELDEAKAGDRVLTEYKNNQRDLDTISEAITNASAWAKEQLHTSAVKKLPKTEAADDLKASLEALAKADENTVPMIAADNMTTAVMSAVALKMGDSFYDGAQEILDGLLNYIMLPDTRKSLKYNREMIEKGGNYFEPAPAIEAPKAVKEQPKVEQEQPKVEQKQPKVEQEQPKVEQEQPKFIKENDDDHELMRKNNAKKRDIPTVEALEKMEIWELVNVFEEIDHDLNPNAWARQFPKSVPDDFMHSSQYTVAEVEAFERTLDMKSIGQLYSSFSGMLNGWQSEEVDEVRRLCGKIATYLPQTGESLKDFESKDVNNWYLAIACVATLKERLADEDVFKETMQKLTWNGDPDKVTTAQTGFVTFLNKLNTYCNAGIPVDEMLEKTGFTHVAEAVKAQAAAKQMKAENAAAMKQPVGLDRKDLKDNLTESGPLNWGSSAEHRKLVEQFNAYNQFIKDNNGRPDPEEQREKLAALNKAAEEYVVLKRENHWGGNTAWHPTTPSGQHRYEAALEIVKITRDALGKGKFDRAAHNARQREIDRVRYAPSNDRERKDNLLKGRRDQYRIENTGAAADPNTIEYEQNEIKKLLNEGKPAGPAGFDSMKEKLGKHISMIITKFAIPDYKNTNLDTIKENALVVENSQAFQHLMASAINWKGMVELSAKALLGNGRELSYDYQRIKEKDASIKQNYQERKNNEMKKGNDIERTSSLKDLS